jgi:hypothetical protein
MRQEMQKIFSENLWRNAFGKMILKTKERDGMIIRN